MSIRFRNKTVGRALVAVISVLGLSLVSTTPAKGTHDPATSVEVFNSDPVVTCFFDEFKTHPDLWVHASQFGRLNLNAYEGMAWKPFVKDVLHPGVWYNHYPWIYPFSDGLSTAEFLRPGDIPTTRTARGLPYIINDLPRGVYQVGAWFLRKPPGSSPSAWFTPWNWSHAWVDSHTPVLGSYCDTRNYGVAVSLCGLFLCEGTSAQAQVRQLSQRAVAIGSHPDSLASGVVGSTDADLLLSGRGQRESAESRSGPSTSKVAEDASRCFGKRPTIVGTEGADVLEGTSHRDVILGLGGDDTIFGGVGQPGDYICAGDGADGVLGGPGRDHIAGEGGDDVLLGESAADILVGGNGIDYIEPGPGNDQADGGGPVLDILSYLSSSSAVRVDFSRGMAVGEGDDTFKGFNAVVGSNGDDSLIGSSGQELFVPVGGNDSVDGGSETDSIFYVLSGQSVDVNLDSGESFGEGSDTLSGVEVVFGSPFEDVILGDAAYNWLLGLEGNDQIDGLAGDDTLDAGGGVDVCVHGLTYLECENQGGDVFPAPPDTEAPTVEPPPP